MRTVVENVYDEIVAAKAATFPQVNQFTKGYWESTKLIFPFINIGRIESETESLTIGPRGSDEIKFTLYIEFGTKSIVPELAYAGDDDTNGLLHIADALREFCRGRLFSGAFTRPAEVTGRRTDVVLHPSGWVWVGELKLVGRRKVQRLQP